MNEINDESIDLVVTSPPYPMIEIWDNLFSQLNPIIADYLKNGKGSKAFELMHQELDKTWNELFRVLKDGGIVCINIGDATRKIGNVFQLFSNHSRILTHLSQLGFTVLPEIIWRKQSNKPNKFMGSGMLPPNAYVTQEHEYILIFRKGKGRSFSTDAKKIRSASAYFWEERNIWFSDIWTDLKGIDQTLDGNSTERNRSAAYPFELAYRLINMFSVQNDTVLDPFLGTGTTLLAAAASNRNSIGYEIDEGFKNIIQKNIQNAKGFLNDYILKRIHKHLEFIKNREKQQKSIKYFSEKYNFKVITRQETQIRFYLLKEINKIDDLSFVISYSDELFSKKMV
ncbi:MAG: DNA-methyltransferase [Candidatus Helarchaeota archaeon]